jgi:hypothetical protein
MKGAKKIAKLSKQEILNDYMNLINTKGKL